MEPWTATVLERLSSPVLDALARTPGVWVVGGAVRDALLGRRPRELDLVVEGDAVALARTLGPVVAVHEPFGTATIEGADLAGARVETYARPGALPQVELGAAVQDDLRRRDFTVNAMAVRLLDGAGAAWPGALEDLRAGVLRVLHERSFLDDPTRLLRMARYAARLGFAPEPGTAALACAAVRGGAPATVSGARLGNELRLALREPLPAALVALTRDGLGAQILHPAFDPDAERLRCVVAEARATGADPGLAALGASLLRATATDVRAALDALAFRAAERDAVVAAVQAPGLARELTAARSPSAVAAAARGRAPEALAVAAALGAAEPVRRWLAEWRHVRLDVTGDDLVRAGLSGRDVGAGLRAALDAALDGRATDREGQLRAAREGVA